MQVVADFDDWLVKHPNDAVAVAAVQALTLAIRRSSARTIMEFQVLIKSAAEQLQDAKKEATQAIQLGAACQLFVLHVTRTVSDYKDVEQIRSVMIDRGEHFAEQSQKCRETIASLGSQFVHDGEVVLTHGYSNVVLSLLLHAAKLGRRFRVIVTEANPGSDGLRMVKRLREAKLRVDVVIDSAVGHIMEKVDIVVCGAQGVVENGGIINKIGTNQISIVARANKKPFYIAAESYKFARMYPLNQSDLPEIADFTFKDSLVDENPDSREIQQPILDYTPPEYITLLFTDLGVLTPSAVSDELIKLYY